MKCSITYASNSLPVCIQKLCFRNRTAIETEPERLFGKCGGKIFILNICERKFAGSLIGMSGVEGMDI